MMLFHLFNITRVMTVIVTLVEKQKETISGESSDRSQKKKLGEKCSFIHLSSYNISLLEFCLLIVFLFYCHMNALHALHMLHMLQLEFEQSTKTDWTDSVILRHLDWPIQYPIE